MELKGRDFLSALDLDADLQAVLLDLAARLKAEPELLHVGPGGRGVALVFEKPSLRTKSSFSVAAARLGMLPVYLGPEDIGLGKRETVADAARNLDRFFDLIVHRTFGHDRLHDMARHSEVPVINALSDHEHPCQTLADLLTLHERFGRLEGLRLSYLGDGNNVCHSLLGACALAGVELAIATPDSHRPDADVVESARGLASADILLTSDPREAVSGAHAVYTDTWIGMGRENEAAERRRTFASYHVDSALMACARPDAVFLHCLPAHRGEEVSDEVMDSAASLVFQQAGNRLPTQQALMAGLLGRA